jgi:hypothetical protein
VLRAPRLVRHALALLEVAAHAEGLGARSGEHHGARCLVPLESIEAAEKVFAHGVFMALSESGRLNSTVTTWPSAPR